MSQQDVLAQAWLRLATTLDKSARAIDALTEGKDPIERAAGYRFLTSVLAGMIEMYFESDPDDPRFVRVMTPTRKFYADNPDTDYDRVALNPARRYRIRGKRGESTYLSFCAYGFRDGRYRVVGNLSDRDMDFGDDGEFEVYLWPEALEKIDTDHSSACPTHWLKLEPDTLHLVARQYFLDRSKQTPAQYQIEILDDIAVAPLPGADAMAQRIDILQQALGRLVKITSTVSQQISKAPNTISIDGRGQELLNLVATPDVHYVGGWYCIDEQQALIVEGMSPDCRYWSIQVLNRWLESGDYRYRPVCLNSRQIKLEADGGFKVVLAHRDPGAAWNWLDTAGLREGCILLRWLQPDQAPPKPTFTVVPFDGLAK